MSSVVTRIPFISFWKNITLHGSVTMPACFSDPASSGGEQVCPEGDAGTTEFWCQALHLLPGKAPFLFFPPQLPPPLLEESWQVSKRNQPSGLTGCTLD